MAIFSQTVAAALAGRTVRRARLVLFDFADGPVRLFEGSGQLRAGDGEIWSGAGELGQIGDIEAPLGGTAPQVTFRLSGVDPKVIGAGKDAATKAKGRDVTVYVQHFDEDYHLLDGLYATFVGVMDQMSIKATGPTSREVSLTAENLFVRRSYAPFAYLSDRDQKRLHPGDRGCEDIASMATKSILWPYFT